MTLLNSLEAQVSQVVDELNAESVVREIFSNSFTPTFTAPSEDAPGVVTFAFTEGFILGGDLVDDYISIKDLNNPLTIQALNDYFAENYPELKLSKPRFSVRDDIVTLSLTVAPHPEPFQASLGYAMMLVELAAIGAPASDTTTEVGQKAAASR
jgi:hypothetical protein